AAAAEFSGAEPHKLRFSVDGKFKIMEMSDPQDYVKTGVRPTLDPRTPALMGAALDAEKPDLVVINGDLYGEDMDSKDLLEYIRQMTAPMEERQVPWFVVYGNHDEDVVTAIKEEGWNKIKQLDHFMSFKHNVNRPSMSGAQNLYPNGVNAYAVGDMYQLIYDNAGEKPLYTVWALDSNSYVQRIPAVSANGVTGYDWVTPEQIRWYHNTALKLREDYGKLNAVMFLHITLPEFEMMYKEKEKFGVVGARYGTEFSSFVNSGLYAAAQLAGDVKGIFVAHAHENDYIGNYNGILLGFDANVGYYQYGPDMFEEYMQYVDLRDIMRGVRIIELDRNDLDAIDTRMVYATDLGVNFTTAELGKILRQYGQYVVSLQEKAGVKVSGWARNENGGKIYYNPVGNIQKGWHTIAGKATYYFGADGVMNTGWQTIDGKSYYFHEDGKLAINETIDGHTVGADGARK
ncbi:MAG: metallophosphoesterase, partial [Oscillospiraceae bacterium]|nr:metallophosphoesterase [Oscillospiraceae bacterium]